MAAPRAYWSGQLRLALVSIPVEIYSAARSSGGIAFHQIHEPSGKRVKYEKTVPGLGPVDPDDIVKGYEYEKGRYVLLQDRDLEAVKLESKKTIDLAQFVDATEIDPIYFDKPFFVVPQDDLAEEAFRVLRDALRSSKKIGLGQLAIRGRETLIAIKPCGRGMVMETLRYADEVNKASGFFRDIADEKSPAELMDLATAIIDKRSAPFDPAKFHDRYDEALRALIESRKDKGAKAKTSDEAEPSQRPSNVVDLMAALRQSVEKSPAGKAAASKAAAKAAPAAKKPAARAAPEKRRKAG